MSYGKVNITVTDQTIQSPAGLKGVTALAGQTERGNIGENVLVRSFEEYRRTFGEILNPTTSQFPTLAKRALDAGAPLWITRIAHLADINDPTSATAVKADGDNSGSFNFDEKIISVNIVSSTLQIAGDFTNYIANGDAHVVNKAGGGTTALTVDTVSLAGNITTIVYSTVMIVGDASVNDDLTWTSVLTNTLQYEAKNEGTWGNFVTVEIKDAASGISGNLDIFVNLTGSSNPNVIPSDLNKIYRDFPATCTQVDVDAFNASPAGELLQITGFTAPVGVVPINALTGGTDDYASVVTLDYLGSAIGQTGIRSFDQLELGQFIKVATPEIVDNTLDQALVQYAEDRGDCIAILRTPSGLTDKAIWIDWRNQAGSYTGTSINNWRGFLVAGDVKVVSPYDQATITIPVIADFIGQSAKKDQLIGEWNNISNIENGFNVIQNVKSLLYNPDSPVDKNALTDIANNGIIPTIAQTIQGSKQVTIYGSRTLQRENSVLKFSAAAETVILIGNTVRPLAKEQLFKANNLGTWRSIYKSVDEAMQDLLDKGAISAYRYEGDQDIDNISQATINQPANIANGEYKFNLYVEIDPTLEAISVNIVASAQGSLITTQTV